MHRILIFFILISTSLGAQSADEIIHQHFEKSGGFQSWNQLNSIYIKGTVQVGLSDAVAVEIYQKRPYFKKVVFEQNGKLILSEGFDGQKAYTYNEGLRKNIELPIYKPDAFETDYFNYKKKGFYVEKQKDTVIDGKPVFHIELVKSQKRDQLFFSKADFSLIQEENEIEVIRYKKYKIFKGLEFSTEIETAPKGGVPYVLRITEIHPNFAIPENTFKF